MYSTPVHNTLEVSGWYPGRKISVEHWIIALNNEGFTMSTSSVAILEEFGCLTVHPRKHSSDEYIADVIKFDPLLASEGDFNRVNYWQNVLKTNLSPIAEIGNGILLVAEDERVFSCGDIAIYLDGISFTDALENSLICAKRKPIEIGRMTHP